MIDLEQRVLDLIHWRRVWSVPTRASDVHHLSRRYTVDDVLWALIQSGRLRMNPDSTLEPIGDRP